jgi:pyruvate dehydrogenase E2 component (dihydrolipoamide acetyltransferase)
VRASPAARRRAEQLGIPLAGLAGSGPGGAVLLADVRPGAGAPKTAAAPAPKRRGFDPAAMRRAIAAAMTRSKREIPHYYLTQTLCLEPALDWLSAANQTRGVAERLLPAALFLRAIGLALARVSGFNGFCEDGSYRPGAGIHVGWAVALRGGGLIAPAIRDVDRRSLDELMAALRDLVARARGGGLRGSELTDATVTVTSLGERGVETVLPIIHPPQVAMIGVGAIVERPWAGDRGVAVKPLVTLTLAADHRVSDGHQGSRLLAEVERLLTQPEDL